VATGVNTAGTGTTATNGVSTDPKAGAHNAHLNSTFFKGYKPGGIGCDDCHAVSSLVSSGHMNGSTTFTWSNFAKNIPPATDGYYVTTLTPSYSSATGACSTNYCHGGAFGAGVIGTDPTPTWTDTAYLQNAAMNPPTKSDCDKCHLSPPTSTANYNHSGITFGANACNACHQHDGNGPDAH